MDSGVWNVEIQEKDIQGRENNGERRAKILSDEVRHQAALRMAWNCLFLPSYWKEILYKKPLAPWEAQAQLWMLMLLPFLSNIFSGVFKTASVIAVVPRRPSAEVQGKLQQMLLSWPGPGHVSPDPGRARLQHQRVPVPVLWIISSASMFKRQTTCSTCLLVFIACFNDTYHFTTANLFLVLC